MLDAQIPRLPNQVRTAEPQPPITVGGGHLKAVCFLFNQDDPQDPVPPTQGEVTKEIDIS
jgi:hypothetical protein